MGDEALLVGPLVQDDAAGVVLDGLILQELVIDFETHDTLVTKKCNSVEELICSYRG